MKVKSGSAWAGASAGSWPLAEGRHFSAALEFFVFEVPKVLIHALAAAGDKADAEALLRRSFYEALALDQSFEGTLLHHPLLGTDAP